jgi:alanine racemase
VSRPPLRSWARVSLDRIAANYHSFRRAVGPEVQVLAVVKADAYGHGAETVARRLTAEGAAWLAVATVEEGVALRESGIGNRILVMGGHLPFEREALAPHGLTTVVHSLEEIAELDRLRKPLRFHLKIDSGMGRLGTCAPAAEIVQALASRAMRRADDSLCIRSRLYQRSVRAPARML